MEEIEKTKIKRDAFGKRNEVDTYLLGINSEGVPVYFTEFYMLHEKFQLYFVYAEAGVEEPSVFFEPDCDITKLNLKACVLGEEDFKLLAEHLESYKELRDEVDKLIGWYSYYDGGFIGLNNEGRENAKRKELIMWTLIPDLKNKIVKLLKP